MLTELKDLSKKKSVKIKHKEEYEGRIKLDADDRQRIKDALETCIHPLLVDTHNCNKLVNIYTGEEDKEVNVNKAQQLGKDQMDHFEKNLPGAFREPLTTKVVLMRSSKDKQSKKYVEKEIYNTDLLFARALLSISTHQVSLNEIFRFELSPVPLSLFDESGEPRYPTNKSALIILYQGCASE